MLADIRGYIRGQFIVRVWDGLIWDDRLILWDDRVLIILRDGVS